MSTLPVLSSRTSLRGKRVLIRVDWNISLHGMPQEEDLLKIQRSADTLKLLQKLGAITLVMTHLGRPQKRDPKFSTVKLLPFAEAYIGSPVMFCGEDITTPAGKFASEDSFSAAKPGDVFLLENVRFYPGEEKNDKKLAAAYAEHADYFVNDAFASSHRAHVSVSGIAKLLPHFAGPQLAAEIKAAQRLIRQPKKPFVVVIGGSKLSTKMPVISSLLKKADNILIGGAMAHAFFAAKKINIGKSYIEKGSDKLAHSLLKNKKIVLPQDALVASSIKPGVHPRRVDISAVKAKDMIGDIGTKTMQDWSAIIKQAQTILWNGPVGVTEIPIFSHGSLVLGRAIASHSKGKAYGVVGGGDTIPVALKTGMSEWFDYISMGGGALLEYIAKNGKLPGILALYNGRTSRGPRPASKSKSRKSNVVSLKTVKKVKEVLKPKKNRVR